MSIQSHDDDSLLFNESDLDGSEESVVDDGTIDVIYQRRQTLEDAMDHLLSRGGWGECVAASTIKLRVPVPQHLHAVFRLPVADSGSDSNPVSLNLLLIFEDNGAPRIELDPVWNSDMTEQGRMTMAWYRGHHVTGSAPYTYMKPLLMSIQNDLELTEILGANKGCLTIQVLEDAKKSALRRLSLYSEQHSGVFSMKEDRDKELLADDIVAAGCQVLDACKSRNLVQRVFDVVIFNLEHFAERCYVCGVEHQPPNEHFIPAPCCNDLCRFKACDKIGAHLHSVVKTDPAVFKLVLYLAASAAVSPRANLIFKPLPPGIEAESIGKLLQGEIDIEGCESENDLQQMLDSKHASLYELMWWLVANLPVHIIPVDASEIEPIIKSLGDATVVKNCDVFRVSGQSTSLNREFAHEKKKRSLDRYAYHGSPKENWYSILKHGPRVMSEIPQYRLNGAALGRGIYLGLNFMTSQNYARGGIVGICEVLKAQDHEISKTGHCWVVKQPALIRIKYLLVPQM